MATISESSDYLRLIVRPLLPSILVIVIKIIKKVEQVKINKRQCQTLLERIQIVTSYLQKPELLKRMQSNDDPLNRTLENFQRFLEQCLNYISSFVDCSRIRKFISSSSHKEEFNYLNNQLQMYYSEVTLGINIKNLIDKKQDEYDQTEDLREILTVILEQQKISADQLNILLENQTKRFDQLEKILTEKNLQPQLEYVQHEQSVPSNDIFKNGIWSNRCFEYGKWHGPFLHQIIFNSNDNTFNGHGEDHIGSFILTGSFSKEFQQINIVLSYNSNSSKLETDNQYQFQLIWNEKLSLFDGLKYKPIGLAVLPNGIFEMSFVQPIKD